MKKLILSLFDPRRHRMIICLFISVFSVNGQQVPDTNFTFRIQQPAYQKGKGPEILIDAAHYNFHTREGGFSGFSRLMEQDGYEVKGLTKKIFGADILEGCKILVIANALDSTNARNWVLPTPSAFSKEEIAVLKEWVQNGGRLLLIADHMPFAGAATDLAKAFGFEFINGFAITGERSWPPTVFYRDDRTLADSPVTTGLKPDEKIDSVATFTGSAFRIPGGAAVVLVFKGSGKDLQPDTAWRFNEHTPSQSLEGCFQGAIMDFGKGKIAVFGEAAMFTTQLVNGTMRVGFNSELAPQNAQFVLNLIHWLDGVKDYR